MNIPSLLCESVESASTTESAPNTEMVHAPEDTFQIPTGPRQAGSPQLSRIKWSCEDDRRLIELRGRGMKWEDISQHFPGRSPISCRLHYQNYLEKRSEWDDDQKDKLARLYERLKPEMWSQIAETMGVPRRAVEAMHWEIGKNDMARRAGVVPFP
ncbi:hypothetical protein ACJ73_01662 [Blastomyces percursus]|uniref:Myb-like domain-containing protein n=1 Tax=Blastomyces percursus TaxID=1658174 RepID=A0A1J9RG22_9EURO|nr:hypothetical protein ACJ73_01662 [Blastomyces percursus]